MTRATGKQYRRQQLGKALASAHRASIEDGRLRFVLATALGFKVSTRRPPQTCLWTNGEHAGTWTWPDKAGKHDLVLSRKLHTRFGSRAQGATTETIELEQALTFPERHGDIDD